MAKLTKTKARRLLKELHSKAFKLLGAGYVSIKDFESIKKISEFRSKQL